MKKKRKSYVPRSTLREKIDQLPTKREKDFWDGEEREKSGFHWGNIPPQLFRQTNEHIFQKSVAAILALIFLGIFSLFQWPLTNRLVNAVHYITVYQTSPAEIMEQVQPVMQSIRDFDWRRPEAPRKPDEQSPSQEETMAVPVNGVLLSPYGTRSNAGEGFMEMHYGIDVAAEAKSPVYAAFSGTVSMVREHPVFGLTIYLQHGEDLVTIYGRCASPLVSEGDRVSRGQQLAVVAESLTGSSHLHFEVWKDGQPLNPQELLDGLQ